MDNLKKLENIFEVKKPNNTKMVTLPLDEYNADLEYVKNITINDTVKKLEETRIKSLFKQLQESEEIVYLLGKFVTNCNSSLKKEFINICVKHTNLNEEKILQIINNLKK